MQIKFVVEDAFDEFLVLAQFGEHSGLMAAFGNRAAAQALTDVLNNLRSDGCSCATRAST